MTKPTLRQFNNGLTVVIVLLGLYIMITPWLPHAQLWWDKWRDDTNGFVYRSELAGDTIEPDKLQDPPEENTLVIPSLAINEKVREGGNIDVIASGGVWRRPNTLTPDQGGNTVIVGHRFSYTDEPTFYHLDKVEVGEKFAVWWNGEEYIYQVDSKEILPPTAVAIENNTEEPIMTLYTCTPIWTAKDRLVIRASLVNTEVLET